LDKNENLRKEFGEYTRILSLPLKIGEYRLALLKLEERYKDLWISSGRGDCRKLSKIYGNAHAEYMMRYDSGDISVLREGVNDFLRRNGVEIR